MRAHCTKRGMLVKEVIWRTARIGGMPRPRLQCLPSCSWLPNNIVVPSPDVYVVGLLLAKVHWVFSGRTSVKSATYLRHQYSIFNDPLTGCAGHPAGVEVTASSSLPYSSPYCVRVPCLDRAMFPALPKGSSTHLPDPEADDGFHSRPHDHLSRQR